MRKQLGKICVRIQQPCFEAGVTVIWACPCRAIKPKMMCSAMSLFPQKLGSSNYPQKVETGRTLANGSRTGDDRRLASPVPDPAAVHERLALLPPFEPNHRTWRETTQPTCTSWHYFCPYLRNGLDYIHNSWNIRHSACLPPMYILMALAFLF